MNHFRILSGAFGNHVKSAPIRLDVFKLHACMRGISAKLSFNGCICFYLSQLINSSIDCIYSCPTENCYRWHFDNAAAGQLGRSHCNTGGNDSHNTKTYFFSMATKHFPSNFGCRSVMQNSMQIIQDTDRKSFKRGYLYIILLLFVAYFRISRRLA
jgi:hypothetical protein